MKKATETICDDNGFEIVVVYEYEKEKSYYAEPGNSSTHVSTTVRTELKSVEVVVKGRGVEILNQLSDKEKRWIIGKLTYQE